MKNLSSLFKMGSGITIHLPRTKYQIKIDHFRVIKITFKPQGPLNVQTIVNDKHENCHSRTFLA